MAEGATKVVIPLPFTVFSIRALGFCGRPEKSRERAEDGCKKKTKVAAGQRAGKSKLDTARSGGGGTGSPLSGGSPVTRAKHYGDGGGGPATATIIAATFSAAPFPGAGPDPGPVFCLV